MVGEVAEALLTSSAPCPAAPLLPQTHCGDHKQALAHGPIHLLVCCRLRPRQPRGRWSSLGWLRAPRDSDPEGEHGSYWPLQARPDTRPALLLCSMGKAILERRAQTPGKGTHTSLSGKNVKGCVAIAGAPQTGLSQEWDLRSRQLGPDGGSGQAGGI